VPSGANSGGDLSSPVKGVELRSILVALARYKVQRSLSPSPPVRSSECAKPLYGSSRSSSLHVDALCYFADSVKDST
jgi:hypothetical protein